MSTVKPLNSHAGPSARDLTAFQWRAAKFTGRSSSNDSAKAETDQDIDVAQAGDRVEGIIFYPGDRKGARTTIHTAGRLKVKAGEALVAGDRIKAGAGGVAMKAGAGEDHFGSVIEAGPAGAIVPFDFDRGTVAGGAGAGANQLHLRDLYLPANEVYTQQVALKAGNYTYTQVSADGFVGVEVRRPTGLVELNTGGPAGDVSATFPAVTDGTYTLTLTVGNVPWRGTVHILPAE
ncbi:hypothetical protein [Deinococcus hohokamensis]|uniref:Peptidase M23 domain-containing protein n=1 Tax=Deinococcus hohokamensis TaxID=309883 RepID=A0ABV9I5K0_9DEIO